MRSQPRSRTIAVLATLALLASAAGTFPQAPARAAADDLGCGESLVEKTLDNGASWRMCARIHPIKGLVLEKVEFRPAAGDREYAGYKQVLDSIYLAQLNVPYDTGYTHYNDITSYGFGNQYLVPQNSRLCRGDTHDVHQSFTYVNQLIERTVPGICTDEVATGLAANSISTSPDPALTSIDQGTALEVSSLSKISWYEYQQKVTFGDHAEIAVGLGATGDLASGLPGSEYFGTEPATGWPIGTPIQDQQYYAASHWHNAIYRVDFGIDDGERQEVEQWDYSSTGSLQAPVVHGAATLKHSAFSSIPGQDHDELTWWRVLNPDSKNKDGHSRSYEIVNRSITDSFLPFTSPIVSFTNAHECQEYASDNLNPVCPAQSILDYVANETDPLTDPVAWVNVGFHHIVRDEDQSPMPVHWQGFQLVPRDFFAQNPSTPDVRQCINGPQVDSGDCIATNLAPPRVSADSAGIKPGTTLTTTSGTWSTALASWTYAYLWFRDGKPIVDTGENGDPAPAIKSTYRVSEADKGTAVTVKVTASQTGFGSGTAESAPVLVPGGTTPTVPTPDVTPAPPAARSAQASSTSGKLVRSKVTVRQNPRLRVTVSAPGSVPSGRFQIRHGSKILKTGRLTNGRATITLPKLTKARTYRLRIVYLGSSAIKASRSGLITVRVVKR